MADAETRGLTEEQAKLLLELQKTAQVAHAVCVSGVTDSGLCITSIMKKKSFVHAASNQKSVRSRQFRERAREIESGCGGETEESLRGSSATASERKLHSATER